jgi:hypothetical protein
VNEINLMGQGDILLIYTDGLVDPFSLFTRHHLERIVSRDRDGSAREICGAIIGERRGMDDLMDDLSLVVIKRG